MTWNRLRMEKRKPLIQTEKKYKKWKKNGKHGTQREGKEMGKSKRILDMFLGEKTSLAAREKIRNKIRDYLKVIFYIMIFMIKKLTRTRLKYSKKFQWKLDFVHFVERMKVSR